MTEQKIIYPSKLEVQGNVKNAIQELLTRDDCLLRQQVNERSISHRLASYLQNEFRKDWNVDCEYNRDNDIPKRLSIQPKDVKVEINDIKAKTVFPDIIVHRRNSNDNLLVIEMKKAENSSERDFDLRKLQAFKGERYHYRHTLYLQLKTGNSFGVDEMQWDGEWVTVGDDPLGSLLEWR